MTNEHKPDAGKIADAMLAKSREHLMGSDANFERVHAVMANLTVRAQSFVSVECVVEVLAAIERLSPQPVAFVNGYELRNLLPDDESAAPDRTPGIQRTQSRFRNVPLYAGPQPAQTAVVLDDAADSDLRGRAIGAGFSERTAQSMICAQHAADTLRAAIDGRPTIPQPQPSRRFEYRDTGPLETGDNYG